MSNSLLESYIHVFYENKKYIIKQVGSGPDAAGILRGYRHMVFKGCIFFEGGFGGLFSDFRGFTVVRFFLPECCSYWGVTDFLGRGRLVLNVFVNLLQLVKNNSGSPPETGSVLRVPSPKVADLECKPECMRKGCLQQ